jgi:p-aminobenzoyl-glutamate transporter AbgT
MNSNATPSDRTVSRVLNRLERTGQWLPGVVALLAAVAVILLITTGQTQHITAVAVFGGSVFAGGTIASVVLTISVNVRNN